MGEIGLKDKDMNSRKLLSICARLETDISDSTRILVRKVQREWQIVLKYKCDLEAKEEEIWKARERVMHLNEKKIHNENHLFSSQKKLENLKSSNQQLKKKLTMLEKEKERVTKSCKEQEEGMRDKITSHQGKWREKYGIRFSNDPGVQQKQKKVSELYALKEKLCSLNEEEKKYEKELFQAKCEKNQRSCRESNIYPFTNFVIHVAKTYTEGRKLYAEFEKTSEAIAAIENKIKNHLLEKEIQLLNNVSLKPKTMETVEENSSHGTIDDVNFSVTNSSNHAVIGRNEFHETNNRKQISIRNAEFERNLREKINNFSENIGDLDKFTKPFEIPSKTPLSDNLECKTNSLLNKENLVTKGEKPLTKGPKVRKWMEKLKIFVPKFNTICEETNKPDSTDETRVEKFTLPAKKIEQEPTEIQLISEKHPVPCLGSKNDSKEELNDSKPKVSTRQEYLAPSLKAMNDYEAKKNAVKNVTLDIPKMNASKYFVKSDGGKYHKNLDTVSAIKKADAVKFGTRQPTKQMVSEDAMDTDASSLTIQKGLQNSALCERMDTDEELKKNENVCLKQNMNKTTNAEMSVKKIAPCPVFESNVDKMSNLFVNNVDPTGSLKVSRKQDDIIRYQDQTSAMEVGDKTTDQEEDFKNETVEKMDTGTTLMAAEDMVCESSEQHPPIKPQDITVNVIKVPENNKPEINVEHGVKNNVHAETKSQLHLQCDRVDNASKGAVINSATPAGDPVAQPMEPTPKSPESILKAYTALESNPKTPLTRQLLGSADIDVPSPSPFKDDSASPGFAYPSRLMYQASAAGPSGEPPGKIPRDVQSSIFAQMAFLQTLPGNNPIDFAQLRSPEDKSEFLASAYEDYLADSPPMIKGTEKSMFAFVDDDSPENDSKDDFFPLFAAGNESGKDKKDARAQFTFNFGSNDQPQSPEENSGFKFLF